MTTAELGLVTTAAVGIAAVLGPVITAWANRGHERAMAESSRRFEQRRGVYRDIGAYLERQRLMLTRVAQAVPWAERPHDLSDEELSALLGRAAVEGSREVQEKLDAYAKAAHGFLGAAMTFESLESRRTGGQIPDGWPEAQASVEQARGRAIEAIDAVERAMRDELDKI